MTEGHIIETNIQCARCGSSMDSQDCEWCPATGFYDEPDPRCHACLGTGTSFWCLSSLQFCEQNPLPDREDVTRHTIEEIEFLSDGSSRSRLSRPRPHRGKAAVKPVAMTPLRRQKGAR